MQNTMSRRHFLKNTGIIGLSLSMSQLTALNAVAGGASPSPRLRPDYSGWEDMYREAWDWDSVSKGTHHVNCWYQRCCAWNVYVKDGIVWREEQSGTYEQTNPEVPDFNPRGCQKGACYSDRMYDKSRIRYPLKRVGERGEGKWQRISWEQALNEIADKSIDVLTKEGPDGILWDEGSGGSNIGVQRTGFVMGTPILDTDSEFGDHHPGAAVTCGKISFASSADDLFYSDLILIWGGNPTYTQIPNAHFINEARYNGAQVITITPDYNASAIHADAWIPVNIASDAAFGLSMAQVIIEEGLYAKSFIQEQTDMPFLIRTDTRLFLRASDLEKGDRDDRFFVYDQVKKRVTQMAHKTLDLDGLDPALEGEFEVETVDGTVTVTPVFALLRKKLVDYTPEKAEAITGTHPKDVRDLARKIARAKAATIITQSNFGKFYHGLEMERAQFLVFALTGQFGKKGSGINGFPMMWISGHEGLIAGPASLPPKLGTVPLALESLPEILKMVWEGHTFEMINYEIMRKQHAGGHGPSSVLFQYYHAGLSKYLGGASEWDETLKRSVQSYIEDSFGKGWQQKPAEKAPKIFFEVGGNFLRRNRGYQHILAELFPKLDMVVTLDWRMSYTAMNSDYVLPAAAYYEQDSIPWTTPIVPYTHATTSAVEPLGESKSDWAFHCLYTKALQERAIARGVKQYTDRHGKQIDLDTIYEEFTFNQDYTETDDKKLWAKALEMSDNVGDLTWDELEEKGFHRYEDLGTGYMNVGSATDVNPDETITANTWHTEKKRPWPTLTRRMQFYIDHEYYMELGEELPVHKDQPKIGGDYPLQMTSGHTRWSIHSAWRDEENLLRLQRGEPVAYVSLGDAKERNIKDGDYIRVYNDMDDFQVHAKLASSVRPGQLIVYHAWEPYQFKDHKSQQAITPSPINPIQLAGGYTHLQPRMAVGTPGSSDRGTRVEMEKA